MNKPVSVVGGALFLCLSLAASPARAQRVQGVDVSQFQFNMNWQTTYDAGVRFAFVRATRGGPLGGQYVDPSLATHITGAGGAGILRGAYHYSRADFIARLNSTPGTGNDQPTTLEITTHAVSEADFFYDNAGAYMTAGFLRPVLDLEENAPKDQNGVVAPEYERLTNTNLTLWANTFIDHLQTLSGAEALVYMNSTYARDHVTAGLNHRDLWLARYNTGHPGSVDPQASNPQTPAGFVNPYGVWNDPIGGAPSHDAWSFWQYSNAGSGPTYGSGSTFIDLDLFNGSLAQLRSEFVVVPEPAAATLAVGAAFLALARRRRPPCPGAAGGLQT